MGDLLKAGSHCPLDCNCTSTKKAPVKDFQWVMVQAEGTLNSYGIARRNPSNHEAKHGGWGDLGVECGERNLNTVSGKYVFDLFVPVFWKLLHLFRRVHSLCCAYLVVTRCPCTSYVLHLTSYNLRVLCDHHLATSILLSNELMAHLSLSLSLSTFVRAWCSLRPSPRYLFVKLLYSNPMTELLQTCDFCSFWRYVSNLFGDGTPLTPILSHFNRPT